MRVALLMASLGMLVACQIYRGGQVADGGPQRGLPPPIEANDCSKPPSADELPNVRFRRKGGRETKASVRSEREFLTVDDVEQGRDLSRYERLDLIAPGPMSKAGMSLKAALARARTFLWEHWRDRRPAYLTFTGSSDDAVSTSHIFVEEDGSGKWRVAWRIVRHMGVINDLPTYYNVEWVRPGGWREPGTPLVPGEQADPKRHGLEFRDKCGDVEQSL
jgi:hypothetical protein